MRSVVLAALALVVALSACSTSSAPEVQATNPPTTATLSPEDIAQAQLEADTKLIKQVFRGQSDAWAAGVESAMTYRGTHTYPAIECTPESALVTFYDYGGVDGASEELIVDGATVETDEGWTMPIGPSAGDAIEGRTYIFTLQTTFSDPGTARSATTSRSHATILDGEAFFFYVCWEGGAD